MTTTAKKLIDKFGTGAIDIETIAVEKDQDYTNETTWWIFEDGSALGLDSNKTIKINNNYGRSVDNEKLR